MVNEKITTHDEKEHNALMIKIDALMKKEENKLTDHEAEELKIMALAAQKYEKSINIIPAPKTLEGVVELKMYERAGKE